MLCSFGARPVVPVWSVGATECFSHFPVEARHVDTASVRRLAAVQEGAVGRGIAATTLNDHQTGNNPPCTTRQQTVHKCARQVCNVVLHAMPEPTERAAPH